MTVFVLQFSLSPLTVANGLELCVALAHFVGLQELNLYGICFE